METCIPLDSRLNILHCPGPCASDALDWRFGVGDTGGCGGFERKTSSFLSSSSCLAVLDHLAWVVAGEAAGNAGLGERGGQVRE